MTEVLQIQHDGQISTKVESSPAHENNSVYKNSDFRHKIVDPRPAEGRFAIVTERRAGDAMDAAGVRRVCSPDEIARGVRQSRVVLAPRPWRQVRGIISRMTVATNAASPGRARSSR